MIGSFTIVCLVTACGSPSPNATSTAPETTIPITHAAPAEPGTAGAPARPPIGHVVPIGPAPEGIVVGSSGIAAVAVRNPNAIVLFDAATGTIRRTVPTPSAARHLGLAGPDGPVLAPLEGSDQLLEVNLADGRVMSNATGVGRQPHDAAVAADGTIVVTNEAAGGVIFVRDGRVVGTLPAPPPQPGGVAVVGTYAAVCDVQGNGVWVYDVPSKSLVEHAPVGVKLTHALALSGGLAAFADTDGGAVFVERIAPEITQVARIDAPGRPYGLAFDAHRQRIYVTLTESNLVRVVDVADPAKPRILADLPTVEQPNSVAVEPRSGAVLVTGSDLPGSVQIISPDLLPPG